MQSLQRYLLVLVLLQVAATEEVSTGLLRNVIQQLSGDFESKLNIYVDCEGADMPLKHAAATPSLLLKSASAQLGILGRFTERALTIACLQSSHNNLTLTHVVKLLWRLHHLPVVYVLPQNYTQLEKLFRHALDNGFVQVLALRAPKLYIYKPYPHVSVVELQDLRNFRRLTQLRNLEGHLVGITKESISPRCFHYTNRTGSHVYAGYMYNLVRTFLNYYNGTELHMFPGVEPIPLADGYTAVWERRINMATRPGLNWNWTFWSGSIVLHQLDTYVMVPYARPIPKAYYFLRPFSALLWLAVIACVLYNTALLNWLQRQQLPHYSWSATFLEVLQLLSYLPLSYTQHYCQGWRRVCIFMALCLCGFILTNLYLALLLSMLTSGLYEPQLNSFSDLGRTKLTFMQDEFDMEILSILTYQQGLNPQLLKHAKMFSNVDVTTQRRYLNTSFIHSAYADRMDFVLYQQKFLRVPLFKLLDEVLYKLLYYVPVSHGLPYLELFNVYLRRFFETGIYKKLQIDAYEEGILSGEIKFRLTSKLELQTFDMEFYLFAYTLLSLGWIVSSFVFIIEVLVERKNRTAIVI